MRALVAIVFALAILASASPRVAADPNALSGHAAISFEATTPQGHIALDGAAAFERSGSLVRVDLTMLTLTDRTKGTSMPGPLPPGGYSIVYDLSSMVYTIWAPSRRVYYSGKATTPAVLPKATPSPSPSATPGSGIGSMLAELKDLRQFTLSLTLSPDKTPIEGHPTTNFDFKFTRQLKGKDPVDVTGRASFADDLGGIPVLVVVDFSSGPAGKMAANLRGSLRDVSEKPPPQTDFLTPSGYTKASSILDVIMIPGLSGSSTP